MGADLVVIVPSRGRPQAVAEMAAAFEDTCRASVQLLFAVDDDDPDADAYLKSIVDLGQRSVGIRSDTNRTMVEALNNAARAVVAGDEPPFAVAFMGDDHRPRSTGWDARYLDVLRRMGTGLVYGDDLLQGERLPTQVAMTSDVVTNLGWMAPPALRHMYVDDFWRDLGVHAGCIQYLSDVVIEHVHPLAGKAEMDAGYERVNADAVYAADAAAYRRFKASGAFRAAVDLVRGLQPDAKRARMISMARASFAAQAAYMTSSATIADIAAHPTDLRDLMGPAVQVRHSTSPLAADVVCVTELDPADAVRLAGAAVVTAGVSPAVMGSAGFTLVRTRTIGDYIVALGVRK